MKKIIAFAFVFVLSLSSCEKDDICDPNTATTPRLVITFYDITKPSEVKNVNNLKVIGEGMTEGIVFNATATGELKYLANGSTISIPLKTNEDTTTYSFILNSTNLNPALVNTDKIQFNYTRENLFVSRACGYKTVFKLGPTDPLIHTDAASADGLWMQYVLIETDNIANENETHVKVYF